MKPCIAISDTGQPKSRFHSSESVASLAFLPPRRGRVAPPEDVPPELVASVADLTTPNALVPVRWEDTGEVGLARWQDLRCCALKHGSRVLRHAGGPRKYGRILRPGQARGMAYRAALLDGEWVTIRWDDGSLENVETKNLTPIVLP